MAKVNAFSICKKFIESFKYLRQPTLRRLSDYNLSSGGADIKTGLNSHLQRYLNLPIPDNKIFATYIWIDGSGIKMRSKDRLLHQPPCNLSAVPKWEFDGSSTGQANTEDSEIILIPCAVYLDPFRRSPHVIVLCETCYGNGKPTQTNHRAQCAKVLSNISDQEPWFGIEQEYLMFNSDNWPIGWPTKCGFPYSKAKYSYCGVGENIAGRDIVESHLRACTYSGMDYGGSNAEVMKGSWEFQIGPTPGIKAADDLWVSRYILSRIGENFGVKISYHPKPMGKYQPGIGCHHNFSTNKMRCDEGINEIKRVCNILCQQHKKYMEGYGLGDGKENRKRLTGKFETASFDSCKWGIADRSSSIRIHRKVISEGKGFLEDRRPAGDCDPYRVCALLAETCLV